MAVNLGFDLYPLAISARSSAGRQSVVLAVPVAGVVATHVGFDPHVREEPVLLNEAACVVRGDHGDHPELGLGVALSVLVAMPERLAVDERFVCVVVVPGVVATNRQSWRQVVDREGLRVQRVPRRQLGRLRGCGEEHYARPDQGLALAAFDGLFEHDVAVPVGDANAVKRVGHFIAFSYPWRGCLSRCERVFSYNTQDEVLHLPA